MVCSLVQTLPPPYWFTSGCFCYLHWPPDSWRHLSLLPGFPGTSLVAQLVKKIHVQGRICGFNPWVKKIPWQRKWWPIPVFLPGKSHRQRSLVDYSPWGCKSWTWSSSYTTATHQAGGVLFSSFLYLNADATIALEVQVWGYWLLSCWASFFPPLSLFPLYPLTPSYGPHLGSMQPFVRDDSIALKRASLK